MYWLLKFLKVDTTTIIIITDAVGVSGEVEALVQVLGGQGENLNFEIIKQLNLRIYFFYRFFR